MKTLDLIATALLATSGLLTLGYIARYVCRTNWRMTQAGRAALFQAVGSLVLILVALGTILFGFDYPGREIVRVLGFSLLLGASWYSYYTLSRYERARNGLGPDPDPHLAERP